MPYRAFATDYDGTLASHGAVDAETMAALVGLRAAGWKLLLVTGRRLGELKEVFPELAVFHLVVLENGALLYCPSSGLERCLGAAPPEGLVPRLQARGVPVAEGRVIVATVRPYEREVLEVLAQMRLDLTVIYNKAAVMVLPAGIDKGSGLQAGLDEIGLSWGETVGIGDGENDLDFLSRCGFSVAVANCVPGLKEQVHLVTTQERGAGVREAIARLQAQPVL